MIATSTRMKYRHTAASSATTCQRRNLRDLCTDHVMDR